MENSGRIEDKTVNRVKSEVSFVGFGSQTEFFFLKYG